jgi:NADH-quinone oxidoreductase subunit F
MHAEFAGGSSRRNASYTIASSVHGFGRGGTPYEVTETNRVLDPSPVVDLEQYQRRGGGQGLAAAEKLGRAGVIDDVEASGLRGRGGAGFPTGQKWRTVAANQSPAVPTTVVVNAAEGEPGSFKDREILTRNPYRVLEGALIAAYAVGADRVIVAGKAEFPELDRVGAALSEMAAVGWTDDVEVEVFAGPSEYLYGEETALLEVLDGRPPFPRIAPPFRHGVDEVSDGAASPADVMMAAPGGSTLAPPTLVNNVETLANIPPILAEGPEQFRSIGTAESPGTVVCTVTGAVRRHGVSEFAMGTALSEVIESIGSGPRSNHKLVAAMSGVAHPLIPAAMFDTPVSFEAMDAIGAGLGAAGFIVFDDETDMAAVAAGVSQFLAVESCGQCTPCKHDGLAMATLLRQVCRGDGNELDIVAVADRVQTVADEARCFLAHQHQRVVGSILRLFPDALRTHLSEEAQAIEPMPIVAIAAIDRSKAQLDERQLSKQPDWTFEPTDSGKTPVERIGRIQPKEGTNE